MLYNWRKIEQPLFAEVEEGKILELDLGNKSVSILKWRENLFAFASTCPHAGTRLCLGWSDSQGRIVCPTHKYRFDPSNGRNTSGEGYKLRTFPVEIREGIIYIGLIE
jgi:nitrite reductase/ring-hydroxylating ferredoxin subunit